MKRELNIIMYHYVRNLSNSRYPDIKGLKLTEFRDQIDYFISEKCNFISTDMLINAIDNNEELPEKSVFLTFDDGYIDHYTNVFPILREKNIPCFFSMPGKILAERKLLDVNKIHFILASNPIEKLLLMIFDRLNFYRGVEHDLLSNEDLFNKLAVANRFDVSETIFVKRLLQVELDESLRNIICDELFAQCIGISQEAFAEELYLSYDQIKLMCNQNMTFGIHGYEHYWMNRLSPAELSKDITLALDAFSGIVDRNNWVCCYPYGSYSDDVANYIKARGAVAGLTTVARTTNLNVQDRYSLSRWDTNDFPPKSESNYIK